MSNPRDPVDPVADRPRRRCERAVNLRRRCERVVNLRRRCERVVNLRRRCERVVEPLLTSGAELSIAAEKKHLALITAAGPVSERLEEPRSGPCGDALTDNAAAVLLGGRRPCSAGDHRMGQGVCGPVESFPRRGIVKVEIGGTLTEASARRRAHAYAGSRRLVYVARAVVARGPSAERDEKSS
jgi:hypothetical protein